MNLSLFNVYCSVQMEAFSIENSGEICFNVYCYNVQPGITINYATGDGLGPTNEQTSKPSQITPAPMPSQPEKSVVTPYY